MYSVKHDDEELLCLLRGIRDPSVICVFTSYMTDSSSPTVSGVTQEHSPSQYKGAGNQSDFVNRLQFMIDCWFQWAAERAASAGKLYAL